jgi:hypothetical protein
MKEPGLIWNDPWLESYRSTILKRMENAVHS